MSADDEGDFGLVLPFTVVKSKGGPFDDDAYAAGFEAGRVWAELDHRPRSLTGSYRTVNVPQLDLIAMHFGYSLTVTDYDEWPDWKGCDFNRVVEGATS